MTFRELDGPDEYTSEESALDHWYDKIRDTPVTALSDEDLACACRQGVHLDAVVPIVVDRLRDNPLAGDLYDGELIASLKSVSSAFWRAHPDLTTTMRELVTEVQSQLLDDDVNRDLSAIVELLANS